MSDAKCYMKTAHESSILDQWISTRVKNKQTAEPKVTIFSQKSAQLSAFISCMDELNTV